MRDASLVRSSVTTAVRAGYRLIDTATGYRNEEFIGATIQELVGSVGGVSRRDLFITSKLAPADQGYDACLQAVHQSLDRLQLDYIDLYLIHWPGTSELAPDDPQNRINRKESWRALEDLYTQGKLRAIGVSNFELAHLEDLMDRCRVVPMLNQVEMHPKLQQKELRRYCLEHSIHVQAYSSLGEGQLLEHGSHIQPLQNIADRHHVAPAQVLLAWALHHGVSVIPKSAHTEHIQSNIGALDLSLSEHDIHSIDLLGDEEQRFCWDPRTVV